MVYFGKGIGSGLQIGKVDELEQLLNNEYENGWELVSMTVAPYRVEPACCDYVLVFKKRIN